MARPLTTPTDERFLNEFLALGTRLLDHTSQQDDAILTPAAVRYTRPESQRDPDLPVLPPKVYPRYTAEQVDLVLKAMTPPPPPAGFTGRKLELDQATVALLAGRSVQVLGSEGIGKTTLLRQLAHDSRLRKQFKRVWWLATDREATVILGLAVRAANVLIATTAEQPRLLRPYLDELGVLLIVDNAADVPRVLSLCSTVIVAGGTEPAAGAAHIRLNGLGAEIGAGLIARLADAPLGEVRAMAAVVEHHPQALRLLAALLREDGIAPATLDQLLNAIEGDKIRGLYAASLAAIPDSYRALLSMAATTNGHWIDRQAVLDRFDDPLLAARMIAFLERRSFFEREGDKIRAVSQWYSLVEPAESSLPTVDDPLRQIELVFEDDVSTLQARQQHMRGLDLMEAVQDEQAHAALTEALNLREAAQLRYATAETLSALARLSYLRGDDASATRHLEAAAEILYDLREHSGLSLIRVALSRVYRRAGRLEAALHVLEEGVALEDWAAIHQLRREWDDSLAMYRRWQEIDPQPHIKYLMADVLILAGRYAEASAFLKDDTALAARWCMAQIHHLQQHTAAAIAIYEQIQPDAPPELLAPLTRALARAIAVHVPADPAANPDALQQAAMLVGVAGVWYESKLPRPIFARQRLSHALHAHLNLMLDQPDEALQAAHAALAVQGERPSPEADAIAYRVIGRVQATRGTFDAAAKAFEAEINARGALNQTGGGDEDEIGVALHELAACQQARGELDRAIGNLRRALTHKDPARQRRSVALTQIALRDALFRQGRYPEGLEVADQLVSMLLKPPASDLHTVGNALITQASMQRERGRAARGDLALVEWIKTLTARLEEGLSHPQLGVRLQAIGLLLRSEAPLTEMESWVELGEQALDLAEAQYPQMWVAYAARRDLARAQQRLGRHQAAFDLYQPLLALSEAEAPFIALTANTESARAQASLGHVHESLPFVEQAVERQPSVASRGSLLVEAADWLRSVSDDALAADYDLKALAYLRETTNITAYAATVVKLAYTRLRLRHFPEAIDTFEEAIRIAESTRSTDSALLGSVLYDMANAHATLGQHKRAASTFKQALAHQDPAAQPQRYAETLIAMARSYAIEQEFANALSTYSAALRFTHLDKAERQRLLIEQAEVFAQSEQPRAAIQGFQAAMSSGDLTAVQQATVARGLGAAHNALGEFDLARQYFAEILTMLDDREGIEAGVTWQAVADGYRAQANTVEALAAYHRALSFVERKADPLRYASIERALGELYLASEQPSAALPHFEHALEAERAQPQQNGGHIVAILHLLAQVHERRSELERAVTRHHEALVYQDVRHAPDAYVDSLRTLGRLYTELRRFKEAVKAYDEAINVLSTAPVPDRTRLEAIRNDLAHSYYQAGWLETAADVYRQVAKSPQASAMRDSARQALRAVEAEIAKYVGTLEIADQSWSVMLRTTKPDVAELSFIRALQAKTSFTLGRFDDANRYIAMLITLLNERRSDLQKGDLRPVMQALAAWLQGSEAEAEGRMTDAQDYYHRAMQTAERDPKPNAALLWVFEQRISR